MAMAPIALQREAPPRPEADVLLEEDEGEQRGDGGIKRRDGQDVRRARHGQSHEVAAHARAERRAAPPRCRPAPPLLRSVRITSPALALRAVDRQREARGAEVMEPGGEERRERPAAPGCRTVLPPAPCRGSGRGSSRIACRTSGPAPALSWRSAVLFVHAGWRGCSHVLRVLWGVGVDWGGVWGARPEGSPYHAFRREGVPGNSGRGTAGFVKNGVSRRTGGR